MLSPNVIIIWPGTNAAIPSGFTRVTELDGKYPKGTADGVDPGDTGGASAHTHTSTAHAHALGAHTHSYTSSGGDGGTGTAQSGSGVMWKDHVHTGNTGAISGGTTNSTAVTYGSVSNDPPYYEVIFIKASGYQAIPDDAVLFINDSSIPDGFAQHSAANNKYYKGAATSGDSGATGGSTTNTHDISHTHTTNTHTHANAGSNTSGSAQYATNDSADIGAAASHTHTAVTSSATQGINSYSGSLVTTETVEPEHTKLLAIQNTSGLTKMPIKKMVAMWDGLLADIPFGWQLCDGSNGTQDMRGQYVKNAPTGANIGETGGSNTHSHAAQSHSHTGSAAHTHSVALSSISGTKNKTGSGNNVAETHGHPSFTSNTTLANYNSANTTANSSSNEPPYYTVAFIEFLYGVGGAALFAML